MKENKVKCGLHGLRFSSLQREVIVKKIFFAGGGGWGGYKQEQKKSHHQIDQQLFKNNVLDFPSPLVLMFTKNQLNPTVLPKFVLREKWNHEVLCNFFIQQLPFCASELTLWLSAEFLIVFNYLIRQQIQAGQPRLDPWNGTNILLSISLPCKYSWH